MSDPPSKQAASRDPQPESARRDVKTLMFFSVDLAGSTDFKGSLNTKHHKPVWLDSFEAFFRELPLVFMGQIAVAFQDSELTPEIDVWKIIGDEIVFRAEPKSADEGIRLLKAFYCCIVAYDQRLFDRWPLRLKGTCWAARFPKRNIEIAIPEMAGPGDVSGATYVDFLGPDVDIGFRISQHAPIGGVIISLNLAEAIAPLSEEYYLRFHFAGKSNLKGVFSGRPYPLLLISIADCLPDLWQWENEEPYYRRLLLEESPMDAKELAELAKKIRCYLNRMCHLGLKTLDF